MKIVIVSTSDISGGAAIAAYRLHQAVKDFGAESTMIVRDKLSNDSTVLTVGEDEESISDVLLNSQLENYCIKDNRVTISNYLNPTLFSLDLDDYDLSCHKVILEADVINIHWCAGFLSPFSIFKLLQLGKPVVWTMHDQFPFTGGCHYTDGCEKYIDECQQCPQLNNDDFSLPALFLREKKKYLGGDCNNLSAVFPSHWLRDCAVKSPIFNQKQFKVIPNSVNLSDFMPMEQEEARSLLKLPEDIFILLFVASDMNEGRKGFDILNETLKVGIEGPLNDLVDQDKLLLVTLGHPVRNVYNDPPVKCHQLNFSNDSEVLRQAYCSADLMLFCSREDNLPNTIIEAMSCGLPTVAYDLGGCSDIIDDSVNGYLISKGDYLSFSKTIAMVAQNKEQNHILKKNCFEIVFLKYTPSIQAQAYLDFFKKISSIDDVPKDTFVNLDTRPFSIHAEVLRRITSRNPVWQSSENKVELVDKWLNGATTKDSIHYLTTPRDYLHAEEGYDEQYGIVENDFSYGNGLGNLLESWNCDFSAPALEIGCGTGVLSLGMCQKNRFPLFIASDASPSFLKIVKKKLKKTGNYTDKVRIAVIDGDALAMAPKQSFSLIVLKATLHHIIDPEQFIKKTSELLVPNGMLVFHEPFWEGNVLLGMMAQTLMDRKYSGFSRKFWKGLMKIHRIIPHSYAEKVSKWALHESHYSKLQLLIDTMKASSRRDIDKTIWEDKHLFKVADILKWGNNANLDVKFVANREFNEFADNASQLPFSYRDFIFTYISKGMNYGDKFARDFEKDLGSSFDYLDQIAANNNSPEYHGIFSFRKNIN